MEKKFDLYEMITNQILEALEKGEVPWQKPWKGSDVPRNLQSKKAYRGMNLMLLGMSHFKSPWWLTLKQVKDMGGWVDLAKESYTMIVFSKSFQVENEETGKTRGIPFLRYYKVWNLEQITGIEAPKIEEGEKLDFNPIAECEAIVKSYIGKPEISWGGNRACYWPTGDKIDMPPMEDFNSEEEYYSTLFHELSHSTGHKTRLNRKEGMELLMGGHSYSKEELVAEFSAAMLCGIAGIANKTIDNSAAYIQNWSRKLRGDKKLIVSAAGMAQKSADFIRGVQYEAPKVEEA